MVSEDSIYVRRFRGPECIIGMLNTGYFFAPHGTPKAGPDVRVQETCIGAVDLPADIGADPLIQAVIEPDNIQPIQPNQSNQTRNKPGVNDILEKYRKKNPGVQEAAKRAFDSRLGLDIGLTSKVNGENNQNPGDK